MKRVISLLLPLFGIIFALLLVEVGYRLIAHGHLQNSWTDRPAFYFNPTNFHGQQDFAHHKYKPEGMFRACIVGDSFTFGPHLQFDDTFPKRLERMLQSNKFQIPVEVHNHGHSGYSTFDESRMLSKILAEDPDLVLFALTLNDLQGQEFTEHDAVKLSMGPYHPSGVVARLSHYWTSFGLVAERIHNARSHQRYVEYFHSLVNNEEQWKSFRGVMTDVKAKVEKSGAKFGVVMFPLFGLPIDESYPFQDIHDAFNEFFTSAGIAHLDLRERYAGVPLERIQVIPSVDSHPNEIAHRMAAEQIYLWILSERLAPKKLHVAHKSRVRIG